MRRWTCPIGVRARVGDHPKVQFRKITLSGERSGVSNDTLACLAAARATPDTERVLPPEMHRLAYEAWDLAKRDILVEWLEATDPRNLLPKVPKALRDAAAILREHPPTNHERDAIKEALDTLETSYPARIQGMFRDAIRSSENSHEQAEAILNTIRELGLTPPTPPEPLPVIDESDIHLVCWMALTPRSGEFGWDWTGPDQLSFVPDDQLTLGEATG